MPKQSGKLTASAAMSPFISVGVPDGGAQTLRVQVNMTSQNTSPVSLVRSQDNGNTYAPVIGPNGQPIYFSGNASQDIIETVIPTSYALVWINPPVGDAVTYTMATTVGS